MGAGLGAFLQVAGGVFSAFSAFNEGKAAEQYYNFIANQYQKQGELAMGSASRQIRDVRIGARDFAESQRAAMAASGISGVTSEDILKDTHKKAALDIDAIKYSANVKEWEARSNAVLARAAGKNAKRAAYIRGFSTLLGTGSQVADYWNQWKRTGAEG